MWGRLKVIPSTASNGPQCSYLALHTTHIRHKLYCIMHFCTKSKSKLSQIINHTPGNPRLTWLRLSGSNYLWIIWPRLARGKTSLTPVKIGTRNGYKIISESVQNVLACKYITPTCIEVVWASVQNVLACKYITPTCIEVVWASVQNVLACKYITPTGIEIVWASVQNFRACKYITLTGIEVVWEIVQNVLACKYITPTGIEFIWASVQNVLSCISTLHPWV